MQNMQVRVYYFKFAYLCVLSGLVLGELERGARLHLVPHRRRHVGDLVETAGDMVDMMYDMSAMFGRSYLSSGLQDYHCTLTLHFVDCCKQFVEITTSFYNPICIK